MSPSTDPNPVPKTSPPPYLRLPGRGGFLISYSQLYLAQDHLLQVVSSGFTEDYQRFFFKNIQGVFIRKSPLGIALNAILIPGVVLSISASLLSESSEARIAWSILSAILLALTMAHLIGGPTCVTHLQTATGQTKLRSLNRVRRARHLLTKIRPLVEQAQGTPDSLPANTAHPISHSPTTESTSPDPSPI